MKPLILIVVVVLLAISIALGDLPIRKPVALGSARVKSAKLLTDDIADVFYDLELMPGQIFTGYWYYSSNASTLTAHVSESPEVSWVVLEGESFISTSCSDIHPLPIHFIAPNNPGVYHVNLIDDSSHWQTIQVSLTVTTTPTPDYTVDYQVTQGDSLFNGEEVFWEGFPMGCLSTYVPDQNEVIRYTFDPELPQFVNTPAQATILFNNSVFSTLAFGAKDTGMYSTMLIREDQWYAFPVFGKWNIHVVDTLVVKSPKAGDRWIVGEPDTIRWESDTLRSIEIRFSEDGGANYTTLTTVGEHESLYVWYPPYTLTSSSNCIIKLADAQHPEISAESPQFTIRAYELVRTLPGGTLEPFHMSYHNWGFINDPDAMWDAGWYGQFDYAHGTDPYTNQPYASDFTSWFIRAIPSDFPDWPLWVKVFGDDRCYLGGGPNPAMLLRWGATKGNYVGSCYGFAISSLLAFDWKDQWIQRFHAPDFIKLFDVGGGDSVERAINEAHTYQYGVEFLIKGADNLVTKSANTTLLELKDAFLNREGDNMCFSISDIAQSNILFPHPHIFAHAVTPYKIVQEEADTALYDIFIYDNSVQNDPDSKIVINTKDNTWKYPDNVWGYNLTGTYGLFLSFPASAHLITPTKAQPKTTPSDSRRENRIGNEPLQVYTNSLGSTHVVSQDGGVLDYTVEDSTIVNTMTGASPIIPMTGGFHQPPIGYLLPSGTHFTALVHGALDARSYLATFTDSLITYAGRSDADSTQHDFFTYDGPSLSIRNDEAVSKAFNFGSIVIEDTVTQKIFDLLNLVTPQNDSLHIEIYQHDKLKLINVGSPKSYNLRLRLASQTGISDFKHSAILTEAGTTELIEPVWDDLTGVRILIDNGNDGTIDDSLVVDNQVTGVNDRIPGEIPKEYSLAQNYPNPFNPTTTISFDIPHTSFVTLKIYDLLGREVAELVHEVKEPGRYSTQWETKGVTSGVYFYQLRADEFVQTRKLILLR